MWSRTAPGLGTEEERGDLDVAVLRSDELVRAALERQILLTDPIHRFLSLYEVTYLGPSLRDLLT